MDEQEVLKTIGKNVIAGMKRKKIGVIEICKELEMSDHTLAAIRRGKPTYKVGSLVRVADRLETPLLDLFVDE